MRQDSVRRVGAMAMAVTAVASSASAQWSSDPMVNLAIADRMGDQALPIVAPTSDGGCWIGWWDNAAGNYAMYVQRLDAAGNEQFAHNGILVSDNPQNSALFGWDMIADSQDHCVIVLSDERAGGDLDIYAYRVSPAGTLVWGAQGVTLSDNADFEPAPKVTQTSDGEYVFVWSRLPNAADGTLLMARRDASGAEVFPATVIASAPGEDPAFADVVGADAGTVVVSWVRDISSFLSPRHIRAQKYSNLGLPLWPAGPISVFDATSVPISYTPIIQSDEAGGAVICWHRSQGNQFSSFVQRLDASGTEMFPHNGVEVSTNPNFFHIDPTLAFDPSNGDAYVFWNERSLNQDMWGIYGQRISVAGTRAWGDNGIQFAPINAVNKSLPRAITDGNGAIAFWFDAPSGPAGPDRIVGVRAGFGGTAQWNAVASNAASDKMRLSMEKSTNDGVLMAWVDDRNGDNDVFAQRVDFDGTLGGGEDPCPADLDGDGAVGSSDLGVLLGTWGGAGPADLSGNGTVGSEDLGILLGSWGPC
ncbi:MAG: hypothetical protein VYC34_00180 [Planctomycetota bacterium]|nr:hypothetical protein [Planctomycetota bacterium]